MEAVTLTCRPIDFPSAPIYLRMNIDVDTGSTRSGASTRSTIAATRITPDNHRVPVHCGLTEAFGSRWSRRSATIRGMFDRSSCISFMPDRGRDTPTGGDDFTVRRRRIIRRPGRPDESPKVGGVPAVFQRRQRTLPFPLAPTSRCRTILASTGGRQSNWDYFCVAMKTAKEIAPAWRPAATCQLRV